MKKLLGLAAALAGIAALTPANAAPPFHTVTLNATIPTTCTIGGTVTALSGPFTGVTQTASIFTVGVTGTTANATSGELGLGTITCTSSQMRITLTPDGWIRRTGGGEITYSAYLKNGGADMNSGNAVISSALGTGAKFVSHTGTTVNLSLQINTNQATGLPAGNYAGTLAVSVDPI